VNNSCEKCGHISLYRLCPSCGHNKWESQKKCVAGCKAFDGGEIKHHKGCDYYPDSLSKKYDELEKQNEDLIKLLFRVESQVSNNYIRNKLKEITGKTINEILEG